MTETPQFHPEVEKALETSGPDVGRVKDVELAVKAAAGEDSIREGEYSNTTNETMDRLRDGYLKAAIAKRAVREAAGEDLDNLALAGAFGAPDLGVDTNFLKNEAAIAARDYDKVQELSRAAAKERNGDS